LSAVRPRRPIRVGRARSAGFSIRLVVPGTTTKPTKALRRRRRTTVALGAILTLSSATAASAPADGPKRPRVASAPNPLVEQLAVALSGIETIPTTAALKATFGAELGPSLEILATDPSRRVWVRARALEALSHVDPSRAPDVAQAALRDEEAPMILHRYALRCWIAATPTAKAGWASYLRDPRPLLRAEAARGLGAVSPRTSAAARQLETLMHRDPSPEVREAARRALGVPP